METITTAQHYLQRLNLTKPKNDDELHEWIVANLGLDISRVAVCEGHVAPFTFLADLFFERTMAAILIANRTGGKTFMSALLHFLNSIFKPNCESASLGAIEPQSKRAYKGLKSIAKSNAAIQYGELDSDITKHPAVAKSNNDETIFTNGSQVQIIIGTIAGVNGPHPQKLHTDEAEIMDPEVFDESRNMSASKDDIRAQDWITSTRKYAYGPMEKLLEENREAEKHGKIPPYDVYMYCVYEAARNVPNCGNGCGCEDIVKGSWDDGTARTFADCCKGRLSRAHGHLPLEDLHKTFRAVSREKWEAQQECLRPEATGLVYKKWERGKNCCKWFEPNTDNGPFFFGADFGDTHPSAFTWYQLLTVDVMVHGYNQTRDDVPNMKLKAGTLVAFDEVYITQQSPANLVTIVNTREKYWRDKLGHGFRVSRRFGDRRALPYLRAFAEAQMPIANYMGTDRVRDTLALPRERVNDRTLIVDVLRCPMMCEEIEEYHFPKKKNNMTDDPDTPVDDFNHALDEMRYVVNNVEIVMKRGTVGAATLPKAGSTQHTTAGRHTSDTRAGESRYMPRSSP
jgi:hypothetical protein